MKLDRFLLIIVIILLLVLLVSICIITEKNKQINELRIECKELTQDIVTISNELEDIMRDTAIEENYDEAATYIAKTVWGEARGCSDTEKAAVIWCILNRVDNAYGYNTNLNSAIVDVITAPSQFYGYKVDNPVDKDIYDLALDVIDRYIQECSGKEDVGRVLPKGYCWFYGDGQHNYFRNAWINGTEWDWSLESPYV